MKTVYDSKNYYADALKNNMRKNMAVIMGTVHQTVVQSGFQFLSDKWLV
jgi:hypothetical protein